MTAIILAGGKSSRLGEDKAWLKIGDKPIISRIVDTFKPIFSEIIIAGRQSQNFEETGARLIPDETPGLGPLGGLYSGLRAAKNDWAFCCGCDMPFINSGLVSALGRETGNFDALICKWRDKIHPLHSFYNKSCLNIIEDVLESKHYRMVEIFPRLRIKYIDENFISKYDFEGLSFFNINTPQSYQEALNIGIKNE